MRGVGDGVSEHVCDTRYQRLIAEMLSVSTDSERAQLWARQLEQEAESRKWMSDWHAEEARKYEERRLRRLEWKAIPWWKRIGESDPY